MSRNRSGSISSSSFLFPNNSSDIKNMSAEREFLRSKESMVSDLFGNQQNPEQCCGLARYRTAPGSFLATLLESTADNNSGTGDDSEALFSAFMDNGRSMKQEIGGDLGYVGSYSVGMETQAQKLNNNGSNLARQTSSPAGFFSGLGSMGGVGNYRVQNHAEPNSSRGVNNQINFSSSPSSTSRFMPTIPENCNETIVARSSEDKRSGHSSHIIDSREYEPWNDSSFNGLKRTRDGDLKMFSGFNGLENQNEETRKKSPRLVHHLSLPNTSTSTAEMQKFLHFQQDTVPCQIRAKRGFATHPRSIAERMRRTRISEKMKKLQDLFPNMDKQTNTSDMLDLAVEYIKDLQKQVKTLTDTRARCICSRGT
ncbi:transcription factor bHLH130-like isoform X1 [Primulina eburnea]|uniref:transcription factor bHLH130-like isoform X1 n=2 Tax=Primulina eburnea TaxID=1245227 RepID=UPI003C6C6910